MIRRRLLCLALACASVSSIQSVARDSSAQTIDPKVEARARFERGIHLFDESDYVGALAEFERAYSIAPHPSVLFNIALARAALGQSVEATDALDRLIAAPGSLPADQIERAKAMRDEQSARVGEIYITTKDIHARIEIDNIEVGTTPLAAPIKVSRGTHVIGAVSANYAPQRKLVTVAGKQKTDLAFDLVPMEGHFAHLTVKTHLPGAEVVANGEVIGKTPLAASVTLAAGSYHMELRREGYLPARTDVSLGDGSNGEISLEPEEDTSSLGARGALELRTTEPSAVMFIDGKLRGVYKSPFQLPAGPHHLRVELAGFFPSERDLVIDPAKPVLMNIYFQPTTETRAAYESSAHAWRRWGYGLLIGGVVIAGAGVGYAVVNSKAVTSSKNQYNDLDNQVTGKSDGYCNPANFPLEMGNAETVCGAELDAANNRLNAANGRQLASYITAGAGGAIALTGLIFLLTSDDPHKYDKDPLAPKAAKRVDVTPFAAWQRGGGLFGLGGTF